MGIDVKTFETIFKQNFVSVTAYCNKYVRDTEEAKDLAHRAFMKVWEKRGEIPEGSNVKALIYRIAHNLSINYIRDHKKFCDEEELQTVESENSEADNDIRAAELEAAVIDTINHLPEKSKKSVPDEPLRQPDQQQNRRHPRHQHQDRRGAHNNRPQTIKKEDFWN